MAEWAGHLLHDRENPGTQAGLVLLAACLQREDRRANIFDRLVQRVHCLFHAVRHLGVPYERGCSLQGHPGGEQPLDDQVVQVAGDPIAVFEQRQALGVPAVLGEFDPDAGLRGEGGHHLHRRR